MIIWLANCQTHPDNQVVANLETKNGIIFHQWRIDSTFLIIAERVITYNDSLSLRIVV